MKKLCILALAMLMLILPCAQAEMPDTMQVINCTEWVSLRAEPDSTAQRFAEVPLGATVYGFHGSNGDFTQCSYDGRVGYILTEYLQVTAEGDMNQPLPQAEPEREISLANGSVRIWREYANDAETLYVGRYDAEGQLMWSKATASLGATELDATEAFVNDKAETPMLMLYNSYYALMALDLETGESMWTMKFTDTSLGGSIVYDVAEDGTMYIGGYYGPDPAAISTDGRLVWRAMQMDTAFYWITEITAVEDGVAVRYDNGGAPVLVSYDREGRLIGHEPYV